MNVWEFLTTNLILDLSIISWAIAQVLKGLKSAAGYIRHELGHRLSLRHVPELIFKIDKSMEYGRHISNIIDQLEIDHSNDDEGEDR